MEKKVPMRMCVVCRTMKEKKNLIRIVKTENSVSIDRTGKKNGRGAYVCNDIGCIAKLKQKKILNKVFSMAIDDAVYDGLTEEFLGK